MPGYADTFDGADPQDGAEALDETNFDIDGRSTELRTFEDIPDMLDLTQAIGDRDEDAALALDADEFDEAAMDDADLEDDNELDHRAVTAEHEDDLDGLGPEAGAAGFDPGRPGADDIDGLEEVRDAGGVQGGEDDVTDFQAGIVGDADLRRMGYLKDRG